MKRRNGIRVRLSSSDICIEKASEVPPEFEGYPEVDLSLIDDNDAIGELPDFERP